ncbi:hypothetical protein SAMN05216275_10547 [Streptosporangium canum]|uniref:Uncharacterized protein n=1 Tax=Streptosporangium canum TaxID=324952 RepID=A0A1I3L8L3_9ACTN|nr:hypothetical protein [Streptosporangium canum]SFI80950.1 hypothetical protein SAMN05216275_10547 [Streptosporangium canum]
MTDTRFSEYEIRMLFTRRVTSIPLFAWGREAAIAEARRVMTSLNGITFALYHNNKLIFCDWEDEE